MQMRVKNGVAKGKQMKQSKLTLNTILMLIGLLLGWTATVSGAGTAEKSPVPDLIQGGKKDNAHDWNLGPTGARGWVYSCKGQTAEARQILVTAVAKNSPADGVLNCDDVILGVGDTCFDGDARIQFAKAITVAEQVKNGGVLKLIRWRKGKTEPVQLKLAVMGSYSGTAPYDCQKSKKIFAQGCRAIAKKGLSKVSIDNDLNALALLASGKEEYLPMLAEYAKKVPTSLRPETWTWYYGYGNIFLAEYVLAIGDQSILPELKRTAMEATMGQSAAGTWGHEFGITPSGNLRGYGCMNQPGLSQSIGLVLARMAGVNDPAVAQAIAKSAKFLRWFVDKGAIPYGDHLPWPGHEDNGKCSSAAVLFDLLGDSEASSFYARMATAAYSERERGHTGNFFNILWAMPGVSRCGPLATGAYLKKQSWYYDLARGWDGSFGYQGSPVGEEEHRKYTKWDCTGVYLLAYALPIKSLYLTGKKPCSVPALKQKEVAEVIAAGRDYFLPSGNRGTAYEGRTTDRLLAGLSSWSPSVRKRSAQALGKCDGNFVPPLLKLLASSNRYARYGACEALGCLGPKADAAASQLRALLKDPDPWLQSLASLSLPALGPEARQASIADLLTMAASPTPIDPRWTAQRTACMALFSRYPGKHEPNPIAAESLEGIDRQLLYPAIRLALQNDDAVARGSIAHIYGKLTDRDLAVLIPDIIKAIEKMAPSNEMFGDGIRLAGIDLMSRLHIREGMALCVSTIEWRWGNNLQKRLEYLQRYGIHAKEVLPQLRKLHSKSAKNNKLLDKAIADIEASTETPALVSLKAFIAQASRKQ